MTNIIPVERGIYRVNARNFNVGACTGTWERRGQTRLYMFIGIRRKFEAIFLDTELATPLEKLGDIEDDRIKLWERYPGSICRFCGNTVTFHKALRMSPMADDFVSPWRHDEPTTCREAEATSRPTYAPLFDLLAEFEQPHT